MAKYKNRYKTVNSSYDNKSYNNISTRLEEFPIPIRPKLILSKELKRQIDYFHKKVGSVEWSGILYYKITKGDMCNLNGLEITATRTYLMDIGTSSYTEYDFNEEIMEFYDEFPEAMEMKMGHIHTHHSMAK